MSSNAPDSPVKVTDAGAVAIIAIDREHAGNSVSLETAQAIRAALDGFRDASDKRGIVITGVGDRFFCSGGDLKAYRSIETPEQLTRIFGVVRDLLEAIEDHPLPVIAAINGHALGGGAELALACDLRFAANHASFGFTQARLGLIPGWNGTERLVALAGRGKAMRLMLSAERLSAEAALAEGLVDRVTGEHNVVEAACRFLEGIDIAPLAISAIKRAVRLSAKTPRVSEGVFEELWFTEDHREAERAFAEKRPPVFRGR